LVGIEAAEPPEGLLLRLLGLGLQKSLQNITFAGTFLMCFHEHS
jgi:hypothetical protein